MTACCSYIYLRGSNLKATEEDEEKQSDTSTFSYKDTQNKLAGDKRHLPKGTLAIE